MGDAGRAHTPDREELDERTRCFECGAIIPPSDGRGLAVAEGIVLCHDCCVRRGGRFDGEHQVWSMPPWFDDLVGQGPHP